MPSVCGKHAWDPLNTVRHHVCPPIEVCTPAFMSFSASTQEDAGPMEGLQQCIENLLRALQLMRKGWLTVRLCRSYADLLCIARSDEAWGHDPGQTRHSRS